MNALSCKNLRKSFGAIRAVDDVSLDVAAATITGLIGPNGCGKTTLLNLFSGFLVPDSGKIEVFGGKSIRGDPAQAADSGIYRTFQEIRLIPALSVLHNVILAMRIQTDEGLVAALTLRYRNAERRRKNNALECLERVGLKDKVNDAAGELSVGQMKLLSLACGLASNSRILLLDEPVAGVDPGLIDPISDVLRSCRDEYSRTLLIVEHHIDVIQRLCDSIFVLHEGKVIASGDPIEVLRTQTVLETYSNQ